MKELTPEQLEFALFLSLSDNEKLEKFDYKTIKDFAKAHNVSESTLYNWKNLESVQKKAEDLKSKIIKSPKEKMQTIFEELETKAMGGDTKSIELYMKNLSIITETLHSEIPTWEELIDRIDIIEKDSKFKKKKYIIKHQA